MAYLHVRRQFEACVETCTDQPRQNPPLRWALSSRLDPPQRQHPRFLAVHRCSSPTQRLSRPPRAPVRTPILRAPTAPCPHPTPPHTVDFGSARALPCDRVLAALRRSARSLGRRKVMSVCLPLVDWLCARSDLRASAGRSVTKNVACHRHQGADEGGKKNAQGMTQLRNETSANKPQNWLQMHTLLLRR